MPLLTNLRGKPVLQWTPADFDQFFRERVAEYEGDSYLVDDRTEAGGYTAEQAQKELSDPNTLMAILECDGLADILADRTACKALKDAILKPRADVIEALMTAVKKLRVPKKRGPKGKMVAGQYRYQQILKLHEDGLSFRKIAVMVYKDGRKSNVVKAHYHLAKRKAASIRAEATSPEAR